VLSESQIQAFERDGYLLVEDVLSPDEIETHGSAVDAGVLYRSKGDDRAIEDKTLYEQSFIQCINLWEDHEDVRPLTFHPRLGEMAAELLRAPKIRIWHDQALYKEPGGRVTDPHQDLPFWPIRPAHQVTAWIPFDGSRRDAGAMAYVPGSHSVGLKKFVDITHTFHPEPYDVLADPKIAEIEPVWIEAPIGSVVFHHSLTVHLASANETDDLRRVFCIIYFADGCVRAAPWPHLTVDRQDIEVGEPVRGDVSPIVWPRGANDLPPTPGSRGPRTGFR
jgi:ectoine hydroxylase-related dioxygenase (phytanoyl-CoA dioxygenase family)